MNPNNNVVINILVNANAQQATQGFNALMVNIQNTARNTAQGAATSFSTYFGANFFANLASTASQALVSGLASGLSQMTMFAARTEELGVAVTGITKVNNLNAQSVRNVERSLKDANIATQTAREVLTRYIAAALPLEKATPLANVAKDLAVISGISSSDEFERLIVGITTLNNRVLRNAGVYVQAADAEKAYAKEIGKSVTDLDSQEKQLAVLNSVLAFGARAHGLYGLAMDTTAKQMRSLERIQQDFSDAVGGKLVPVLGLGVKAYTALLKAGTELPGTTILIATALTGVAVAAGLAMTSFTGLTAAEIANAVAGTGLSKILQTASLVMSDFRYAALLTGGEIAVLSVGMLGIVGVIGGLIYALVQLAKSQTEMKRLSDDQLQAHIDQGRAIRTQINDLQHLQTSVNGNANAQALLTRAYMSLDPVAQARIDAVKDETARTQALITEKKKLADMNAFVTASEGISRVGEVNRLMNIQIDLQKQLAHEFERYQKDLKEAPVSPRKAYLANVDLVNIAEEKKAIADNDATIKIAAESVLSYSKITGLSVQQVLALGHATDQTRVAIEQYITQTGLNTSAQEVHTSAIRKQINEYLALGDAMERAKSRSSIVSSLPAQIAQQYIDQSKPGPYSRPGDANQIKTPDQLLQNMLATHPELQQMIKDQNTADAITKRMQEKITPVDHPGKKGPKSELDSLSDSVRKLNAEVGSFQNLTTKEFQLRFQKEELDRVKRDFESILNLRRELGMRLDLPLPGTGEAAKAELDRLERMRAVKEDILKIANQTKDAEDQLSIARAGSMMAVVSAQTLADTNYFSGLRKRAEGEQQLTADIITEVRRRTTAQTDSLRQIGSVQAEAYKDFIQKQNDADDERLKTRAKLELLAGGGFTNNPLMPGASATASPASMTSPVVQRIDTTNKLLSDIRDAVGGGSGNKVKATGSSQRIDSSRAYNSAALQQFARSQGFESVHGFEKGGHNPGSLHYLNRAADVRIRGKSPEEIPQLMQAAILSGIRVVDERTRPPGQKVWGGPNVHLEENDTRASFIPRNPELMGIDQSRIGPNGRQLKGYRGNGGTVPVIDIPMADPAQTANFEKVKEHYRQLNALTVEHFHMFESDKRISEESFTVIDNYLQGQKKLYDEGIKGLQRNAVGQDRLNQLTHVQVTQVGELAVSEARLNNLRGRDAISVLEVLNDAEKKRNDDAAAAQATLIANEEFLRKLRAGDPGVNAYLKDTYNADRSNNIVNANRDIFAQNQMLAMGGRDKELESLNLLRERNDLLLDVGKAEANLEQSRALNADAEVQRARQITSVTQERTDLENQLVDIQNARATGPYNQSLREEVAIQQELLNIQRADLDARTQIAAISVQMADKTVYHQDQANAKVLEHINQIKGLTELYSDAKINIVDGLFGGIDNIFTKLTGKIPIVSKMLADLLSGLVKLFLSPLLSRLLGGGSTGGASGTGGGSGGGFNIGNILGGIFGGRSAGPGGTPMFNPGGSGSSGSAGLLGMLTGQGGSGGSGGNIFSSQFGSGSGGSSSGGGNIFSQIFGLSGGGGSSAGLAGMGTGGQASSSAGMLQQLTQSGLMDSIMGGAMGGGMTSIHEAGNSVIGGGFSGIMGGASPLQSLGMALPMIGLGIGSSLYKDSKTASVLGGLGGLAGGIAALGFTGGLTGALGAMGASLATALSVASMASVIGLIAAPALLIAGFFINRNARRKKERKIMTQNLGDAKTQMQAIIENLRSANPMDSASALSQAQQIRANYIQQVSQLKDKKVRGEAMGNVRELDAMIETIKSDGRRADYAAAQENAIVPTFASGGYPSSGGGMMRGQFTGFGGSFRADHIPAMLTGDEVVLNSQNIRNLGGYQALRKAGVRGIDMFPRVNSGGSGFNTGSGGSGDIPPIYNILVADEKAATKLFEKVKGKGVARKLRLTVQTGNDDGFLSTIEKGLAEGF